MERKILNNKLMNSSIFLTVILYFAFIAGSNLQELKSTGDIFEIHGNIFYNKMNTLYSDNKQNDLFVCSTFIFKI